MMTIQDGGIPQRLMVLLSQMNKGTISRQVSSLGLTPIDPAKTRTNRYSFEDCRKVLAPFIAQKHPISRNKYIQSFYNFKGGTGKTTICYQMATHIAMCGYKVLAIDTDQQGNLSTSFGFFDNMKELTLYDGIVKNVPVADIVVNICDGLDLIPGNISLVQLEQRIGEKTRREDVFGRYLEPIMDDYDFVLFDCNPSVSNVNRNILNLSQRLNIVAETQPNCLSAMPIVIKDTQNFYEDLTKELLDICIIPSKYEDRSSTSAEAISFLNTEYKDWIIPDFAVRKSEDFLKSSRDKLPLAMFCKVNSIALEDIVDLLWYTIKQSEESTENREAA